LKRILAAWKRGGISTAVHTFSSRVRDALVERRSGRKTSGLVPIEALIENWRGCHDYFPTAYGELRTVLSELQIGPDDVFVDIGCGKGRVMLVAAQLPLRAVLGIEISPDLCAEARSTIASAKSELVCPDIRVIEADAARWTIPPDVTLIYLYNPFHGDRLRSFFGGIRKSWECAPRVITIIYNNPSHFEPCEEHFPWLRRRAVHNFEYRWIVYQTESPGMTEEIRA
jgi:SAM-dependent methyltransferase